jgi:tetratricopeptide (TPR) repeat protein
MRHHAVDTGTRFLVVDETVMGLNFIRRALENITITSITETRSLKEANRLTLSKDFDVIIINPKLIKGADGKLFCRIQMIERFSRSFIFIMYHSSRSELLSAIDMRPNDILMMPMSMHNTQTRIVDLCHAHRYSARARDLFSKGLYPDAFKECREIAITRPGSLAEHWAMQRLIEGLRYNKRISTVQRLCEIHLSKQSSDWAYIELIQSMISLGLMSNALYKVSEFKRKFPNHSRPYNLHAEILINQGNIADARHQITKGLTINSQCQHCRETLKLLSTKKPPK